MLRHVATRSLALSTSQMTVCCHHSTSVVRDCLLRCLSPAQSVCVIFFVRSAFVSYSHHYVCPRAEENEHEVRVQGGLRPVLSCVKAADLETRRFALRLLCNLSISGTSFAPFISLASCSPFALATRAVENKVALGPIGGVAATVHCVTDTDSDVRCYALATIMHLCVEGNACIAAGSELMLTFFNIVVFAIYRHQQRDGGAAECSVPNHSASAVVGVR